MPLNVLFLFFISLVISCTSYQGGKKYGAGRPGIVGTAEKYLGVRYKYGGVNPDGFDCSGFVMYVYRKNGLPISRVLKDQYNSGKKVALSRAKPGDLVFFNTIGSKISHVGIYIGDNRFIHAPTTGKNVSYASLTNGYWKKRYVGSISYF